MLKWHQETGAADSIWTGKRMEFTSGHGILLYLIQGAGIVWLRRRFGISAAFKMRKEEEEEEERVGIPDTVDKPLLHLLFLYLFGIGNTLRATGRRRRILLIHHKCTYSSGGIWPYRAGAAPVEEENSARRLRCEITNSWVVDINSSASAQKTRRWRETGPRAISPRQMQNNKQFFCSTPKEKKLFCWAIGRGLFRALTAADETSHSQKTFRTARVVSWGRKSAKLSRYAHPAGRPIDGHGRPNCPAVDVSERIGINKHSGEAK